MIKRTITHRCEAPHKHCDNMCVVHKKDVRGKRNTYFIICDECKQEGDKDFKRRAA